MHPKEKEIEEKEEKVEEEWSSYPSPTPNKGNTKYLSPIFYKKSHYLENRSMVLARLYPFIAPEIVGVKGNSRLFETLIKNWSC